MSEYHKIQSIFKRDPETKYKTLLEGEYSLPEFEYLKNNEWIFTEKVDGTNIRIIFDGQTITFGGRTNRAQIPVELFNNLNRKFTPQSERMKDLFSDGCVLYGEGYGPKIQKGGGLYRSDQNFVLFDVRVGNWWLKREDVMAIADTLKLEVVPVVDTGTLEDMVNLVKTGCTSKWGDFIAEGLVARPKVELITRGGHRIITKIKHKDFTSVLTSKKTKQRLHNVIED